MISHGKHQVYQPKNRPNCEESHQIPFVVTPNKRFENGLAATVGILTPRPPKFQRTSAKNIFFGKSKNKKIAGWFAVSTGWFSVRKHGRWNSCNWRLFPRTYASYFATRLLGIGYHYEKIYFSYSGRSWSLDYTVFSEKQYNLSVFVCYFTCKHSRRTPESSLSLHCLPTTHNVAANNLSSLIANNQPWVSEINGRIFRTKPFCWHESKSRNPWGVMVPMVTVPLF